MRALLSFIVLSALVTGCSRSETIDSTSVDATSIFTVDVRTDDGRIEVAGGARNSIDVTSTRFGTGNNEARADERRDNTTVSVVENVVTQSLEVTGTSGINAGVDFDVRVPSDISVIADTDDSVVLRDVNGIHSVNARSLRGQNVVGEGDFFINGGNVDLVMDPYADISTILIDSNGGDVRLGLPYGLDYDLTVQFDDAFTAVVEDLGFDRPPVFDFELITARAGFRSVRVDVLVRGGEVEIYGY